MPGDGQGVNPQRQQRQPPQQQQQQQQQQQLSVEPSFHDYHDVKVVMIGSVASGQEASGAPQDVLPSTLHIDVVVYAEGRTAAAAAAAAR
jgi:hypothetical protein